MVYAPPFDYHYGVIPPHIIDSFFIDDDLIDLRQEAYNLWREAQKIYRAYAESGEHSLVSPQLVREALGKTDHTTLRDTRNENAEWMRRIGYEATTPVPMRAVCTWPDWGQNFYTDKLTPLAEYLRAHPEIGIAIVVNYPQGDWAPQRSQKTILEFAEFVAKHHLKNPIDIDSVANVQKWMAGDIGAVEAALEAEGEACKETDFTWKLILGVAQHAHKDNNGAYGRDTFRSIYDLGIMGLEHGADCLKTSTGLGAKPPNHLFTPEDTGPIYRATMMLAALKAFNKQYGETRWPKFSGGNKSEIDAAVLTHATQEMCGQRVRDKMAFGTSPWFRHNLLTYLHKALGEECGFDPGILQPYDFDPAQVLQTTPGLILPSQTALPDPSEEMDDVNELGFNAPDDIPPLNVRP